MDAPERGQRRAEAARQRLEPLLSSGTVTTGCSDPVLSPDLVVHGAHVIRGGPEVEVEVRECRGWNAASHRVTSRGPEP